MDAPYSTRMRANAMVRAGLSVTVMGFPEKYPDEGHEHLFEYVSAQSVWSPGYRRRFNWWRAQLGNYGIFLLEPWCVMATAYQMAKERGMDIVYLSHLEPCVVWPLVHFLKLRRQWLPTVGVMPGLYYHGLGSEMYPLVTRARAWLNDYFARRLTAHMRVCYNSKYVVEIMGVTDDPGMVLVPEGYERRTPIPDQCAARARLNLPAGERMALLFGVASKTKGADLMLQALEGVPPRFVVCIVGKTGGMYDLSWGDLSRLQESGWKEKLRVVSEYVSDAVMYDYYAACDGVVIPYRKIFAATSTHLRLAAEFGKAVIACDQYLIGEMVRKYDLGLLFPPEDVNGLRDCLMAFAEKPVEWFDRIRRNSMRVVEDFNWDKIGFQYKALFETVLRTSCGATGKT